ncbi:MAG: hypothetical protein ACI8SR_000801 [Oceanicoccus sp.]|jgi:hypothetical protein
MLKFFVTTLALLIFVSPAFASRVHPQTYEDLTKKITTVCVLKVNRVESEERFYHFKDGSKHLLSKATIVYGDVVKNLYGSCGNAKVASRFVTRSTVEYMSDKSKKFVSLLRPGSGHEHLVEQGKEYIFSYTDFKEHQQGQVEHRHLRMDLLEDESKLIKLLTGA